MPKVFVVSNNGYDFSQAERFGELVFLTSGIVNVNENWETIKEGIGSIVKLASPEDFLLLVGINLLCVTAYDLMSDVLFKHEKSDGFGVKLLHWNSIQRDYVQYIL